MSMPNRPLTSSSVCRLLVLLTITLLLVNAYVVKAQDNANTTNSNSINTNVGGNSNTNGNTNGNANQNGNANSNANQTAASPSPASSPCSGVECRKDQLATSIWFPITVIVMFAIVLLPFAWTIVRAIKFSRATYGPLGLPEGSLRAMLAYTLVAFVGFYILASILSFAQFDPPEFLLGVVATVIGFYFGSRTSEDKAAGAKKTGTVQGNVTDVNGAPKEKATVDLYQSGVKKDTETTDVKGNYKFDRVAAGEYEVEASAAGSGPSNRTKVAVKEAATQSVNLKLT